MAEVTIKLGEAVSGWNSYNHLDPDIVDISDAIFKLSLSILILNAQYEGRQRCQQYLSPKYYFKVLTV